MKQLCAPYGVVAPTLFAISTRTEMEKEIKLPQIERDRLERIRRNQEAMKQFGVSHWRSFQAWSACWFNAHAESYQK